MYAKKHLYRMSLEYGTLFKKGSDNLRPPFEEDVCLVFDDTSCMNDSWKTLIVVPAGSDVVECVNSHFDKLISVDRAILELLGINSTLNRQDAEYYVQSYVPGSTLEKLQRKFFHRECVITGLIFLDKNIYKLELEY